METKKRNNVGIRQISEPTQAGDAFEMETLWMAVACSLPVWVYWALELAQFVIETVP